MKDLKEKTIRGGFARLVAQAATFGLRLVSVMVLARLLGPTDYGLVGMVTAFTGILNLLKDFGLSAATIQREEVTEEQISTLFWVNILVGLALGLMTMILAPAIVALYHEPRLLWVTIVMAAGFMFNAAGVQHSALLQRQMRFTALAVTNVAGLTVGTGIAIIMALLGYHYWALVAMTITVPLASTVGLWFAAAWVPGMPQRGIGLRSLMKFGGTVTLNSIVSYVAYNMDKVLLGRFCGVDAVGLYGRAFQLVNIPTDSLNWSVGEVAFAALSRVQSDAQRLRNYFLKGYALVLALTLPITIISTIFARDLIIVLLGRRWEDAVDTFRLLAPTIVIFGMLNPMSWLLVSLGRVERSLKIALVIAPLVICGYIVGLPHGPKGVASGYSVVMTVLVIPLIAWCVRGTPISFADVARTVAKPFTAGLAAGLVAAALQSVLATRVAAPQLRLLIGGGAFSLLYAGVLLYGMGQRAFYLDLLRGLRKPPSVESAPTPIG